MRRRHLIRLLVPGLLLARFARASTEKDARIEASKIRIKAEIEAAGFAFPLKKPSILIKKKDRTLELFDNGKLVKKYEAALGLVPEGHKQQQGDYKTPEGKYFICNRNYGSAFHLFMGLNYPNANDARAALAAKKIDAKVAQKLIDADTRKKQPDWYTGLGGAVGIHGGGVGNDWTWGCIALTDDHVEELWTAESSSRRV
jgi:murein L,D-transpeptidase YafK